MRCVSRCDSIWPVDPPVGQARRPRGRDKMIAMAESISGATHSRPSIGSRVWRDGKLLVFDCSGELPDRCLRCNGPAQGNAVERKLKSYGRTTISPWSLATFFLGVIVINERITTARVRLRFCSQHARLLRAYAIGKWACLALGLAGIFWAAFEASGLIALLGLSLIVLGATCGTLAGSYISLKRAEGHYIWLGGVSKAYLSRLPSISQLPLGL